LAITNVAKNTTITVGASGAATYGGTVALSATLSSGSAGVPNETVAFNVARMWIGTASTDANGVATLAAASLAGVSAGSETSGLLASLGGDATYIAASATANLTVDKATPAVSVTDAGGAYNGSPYAATTLVAGAASGVDTTPAPTLENVGLTLDYQRLNANGSTAADLGSMPPTAPGSYAVVASFAGSADYAAASNSATFTIYPAGATMTAGLYDASTSTFYLKDSDTPGLPDTVVPFQPTSDPCIPVAGDWTDSGTTRIGLYDPTTGTFYLADSNAPGTTYSTVVFRPTSDTCVPVVGDWNGGGATTVGLYDPKTSMFYERDRNSSGPANASFVFGPAGDNWVPVAGNWTGSGATSVGLYNLATSVFCLRNGLPRTWVVQLRPLPAVLGWQPPWPQAPTTPPPRPRRRSPASPRRPRLRLPTPAREPSLSGRA
jgi:hypothetical protein